MSITSEERYCSLPRSGIATIAATRSPAASGDVAKTADCIFTPVGMPRIGTRSPAMAWMSRAVPSPPANRMRSMPALIRARTAFAVSVAVVSSPAGWDTTWQSKPASTATAAPIAPPAASTAIPPRAAPRRRRARSVRASETGSAPSLRAVSDNPSVPFKPTRPPIPATGLTIKPSRSGRMPLPRRHSAAWVLPPARPPLPCLRR